MDIAFDPTVIAVILGLVEFLKQVGVQGQASLVASLVLGLALGAGQRLSEIGTPADFAGWFGLVIVGLAYGLAASGLFDFAKRFEKQ
jgi:hypothetical protein